jgi:hypothetical protein
METSFRIMLLCLAFMLLPGAGHCAPAPSMPPLSGFHQPVSPCPVAAPDIVTMVGKFKGQPGAEVLTVVASTAPEDDYIANGDARLEVFDAQCHVVFSAAFPDAMEVSFETLNLEGTEILHVVSVVEGADDVHYTHMLMQLGGGAELVPIQPMELTSDAASSFYVGPLGGGKGYGVVQSYWPFGTFPTDKNQVSLVFTLQQETLENGMTMGWFAGPEIFKRPNEWTKLSQNDCDMGFPLLHYLGGGDSFCG